MLNRLRQARVLLAVAALMLPSVAAANLMQSGHFRLDPNVADTFGGASSSGSYKLTDAGGETAVGAGSSQSYHLGAGYVRQLAHSLQLTVLPSGTYAYWPFDTNSGSVGYDVGPNGDDGTLVNENGSTWTTGMVGKSVNLDGSTQYIPTKSQVSGPTAFTLECWFKSTSASDGYLMGFGDAATGASTNLDRLAYLDSGGHVVFGVNPGAIKTVATSSSYNDGSWHYLSASMGSAGLKLYLDGVLRGADASTATAGSYSGYWRFGYDNLTGWTSAPAQPHFNGSLDEGRVYNRQLTDAEVSADYTAGANALQSAFTLPNVTPGQSQTYSVDAVVKTDAGGYDMYVQRPKPLTHTDGTTTIPDISGSIASPILWTEGTTKGFGFTLTSFYGTDTNWGSSPSYKYAALPSAATLFHTRTGLNGGVSETTTMQYRVDTLSQQKQGTYSTTVTYTATAKP